MDSIIFFYLVRMGGHNKDISITIKKIYGKHLCTKKFQRYMEKNSVCYWERILVHFKPLFWICGFVRTCHDHSVFEDFWRACTNVKVQKIDEMLHQKYLHADLFTHRPAQSKTRMCMFLTVLYDCLTISLYIDWNILTSRNGWSKKLKHAHLEYSRKQCTKINVVFFGTPLSNKETINW